MRNYKITPHTGVSTIIPVSGTPVSRSAQVNTFLYRFTQFFNKGIILSAAYASIGFTILGGEYTCLKEDVKFPAEDICHMPHAHHKVPIGGVTDFAYSSYTNVGTTVLASGTLNSRDVIRLEIDRGEQVEIIAIKTRT